MNPIYLSSGAFVGRINGRNIGLLTKHAEEFRCDGFEFMVFEDFYAREREILADFRAKGLNIPVLHTDKALGDHISSPEAGALERAKDLLKRNMALAQGLGAKKLVLHGWGIPDSDVHPQRNYERIGELLELTLAQGLDLLVENCFCVHHSPLGHFEALAKMHPRLGFILDTRPGMFHRELENSYRTCLWNGRIRHIHISDYQGGYKDWNAMYPIPQPGQGMINWPAFFAALAARGYEDSITLEAPAMLAEGVDAQTLNSSLDFLRAGLAAR